MITREVLQLTPSDIEEWKLILTSQRIFPISYTAGRRVVNKAGKAVGNTLRPLKGVDSLPT
jgi:hypothetical protein